VPRRRPCECVVNEWKCGVILITDTQNILSLIKRNLESLSQCTAVCCSMLQRAILILDTQHKTNLIPNKKEFSKQISSASLRNKRLHLGSSKQNNCFFLSNNKSNLHFLAVLALTAAFVSVSWLMDSPNWSALGNLKFERRAEVLTFFGRSPKMMCVQNSLQKNCYQKTSFDIPSSPRVIKRRFLIHLRPPNNLLESLG